MGAQNLACLVHFTRVACRWQRLPTATASRPSSGSSVRRSVCSAVAPAPPCMPDGLNSAPRTILIQTITESSGQSVLPLHKSPSLCNNGWVTIPRRNKEMLGETESIRICTDPTLFFALFFSG